MPPRYRYNREDVKDPLRLERIIQELYRTGEDLDGGIGGLSSQISSIQNSLAALSAEMAKISTTAPPAAPTAGRGNEGGGGGGGGGGNGPSPSVPAGGGTGGGGGAIPGGPISDPNNGGGGLGPVLDDGDLSIGNAVPSSLRANSTSYKVTGSAPKKTIAGLGYSSVTPVHVGGAIGELTDPQLSKLPVRSREEAIVGNTTVRVLDPVDGQLASAFGGNRYVDDRWEITQVHAMQRYREDTKTWEDTLATPIVVMADTATIASWTSLSPYPEGVLGLNTDTFQMFVVRYNAGLSEWFPQYITGGGGGGTVGVWSFNSRFGTVVSQAGDYTATMITNAPAGNISSVTVQAAINELDGDKVPTTRTLSATLPLRIDAGASADLSANRTFSVNDFAASGVSHARGTVPDPGAVAGTTKFLREDATWDVPPGIAHNLLSTTHSDTLTGSPVRGDLVIANSTPKWDKLAIGTAAKYLRSDGTDPSWQTIAAADITGLAHNLLSATHTDSLADTVVRGDVLIGNSTPKWSRLAAPATIGWVLTWNGTDTVWAAPAGGGGTVTAVSVATANGFAGTSSGGATPILTLTTTVTGMLKGDGTSISAASAGTDYGLGSVTSVALSAPADLFTVTGSPVTTTGTLTLTKATVTANYIYAGPTTGAAAAPTFRALVAADVPTLNQNTTGSAAKWTTARLLAGNSVDGSADVPFANKFIVQGTADTGLTGAQFLGALSTGLLKNTTTTGVLSIAVGSDLPAHNLLSAQHFDTAVGIVQRGSMIVGNSTPAWSKLAIGVTGSFIRSDGTDVSWQTIAVSDVPLLNQDTTGSAAKLSSTSGGTFAVTGPTVARSYAFPDAAATILYSGGALGTPSSGTLTNCGGTATSLIVGGLDATVTAGYLQVDGPTVARLMTTPDAAFTVARTDAGNQFTGDQWITGKVGIGSLAAPAATLELANANWGSEVEVVRIGRNDASTWFHSIKAELSSAAASSFLAFYVNTGTLSTQSQILKLSGDLKAAFAGAVGVGVAPTYKLDVLGADGGAIVARVYAPSGGFEVVPYYSATYGVILQSVVRPAVAYTPMSYAAASHAFYTGGVHVGGTSDAGDKNLVVDGLVGINQNTVANQRLSVWTNVDPTTTTYNIFSDARFTPTAATASTLVSIYGSAQCMAQSMSAVLGLRGVQGYASTATAGTTAAEAVGVLGYASAGTGATTTNAIGVYAYTNATSGTITKSISFWGRKQTSGGTSNISLLLGETIPSGSYAIYDNTGYDSVLGGNLATGNVSLINSAAWPGADSARVWLHRTAGGGSAPFDAAGHVIIQSRQADTLGIGLATGATPSVKFWVAPGTTAAASYLDGGLHIGGTATAGDNNLLVDGTINKITFTTPATAATLTIADNKTVTVNNTLTFSGTDSTTLTFPTVSSTMLGKPVADVNLATQAASIGATNLYASAPAGCYLVTWAAQVTRAATSSSSVTVTIGWNNGSAKTSTVGCVDGGVPAAAATPTNTLNSQAAGMILVCPAAATAITYATTYASSGATTMQYSLKITVTRLM